MQLFSMYCSTSTTSSSTIYCVDSVGDDLFHGIVVCLMIFAILIFYFRK